ncbi:ectoine/hydroxyectoine ABC transporter permease subunit EhuD [Ammoniphilus sp. 3BR4]|uniref:ectoine/hydroxyectoine ABC transporter permease subunit EhuD n=1 Tax=Ammoniphilus sp. 3BR4 TaxID=3158265 RepID=UPI0034664660
MWDWEFAWSILPDLLNAMKITIAATIIGFLLAAFLGLVWVFCRRSTFKPLVIVVTWFTEFIRSTPLLVQLFFIFYVLPEFGISFSSFVAGVIGLGLHYSTYLAEVYRSSIESLPKGQWEASIAINHSKTKTWFRIILPQAIGLVIPILGNYFIVMFKETPLLSAITLIEMMQTAKIIGSTSFRYFESFTIVGLLFLLLSYPSSILIRYIEEKMNKGIGKGTA